MNITILQKCIDELNSESPRLDYIRGMLETLIAMSPKEATPAEVKKMLGVPDLNKMPVPGVPSVSNLDEIKRMAGGI